MNSKEFEKLVGDGIDMLPQHVRDVMNNVVIVVEEHSPVDEKLFGLYEGVPLTERGEEYSLVLPDKISIFKDTILETYTSPEDIRECVANTVWHEVAHHFGYDEEWVEAEELKRGKLL